MKLCGVSSLVAVLVILFARTNVQISAKSIILANYHNLLLYFPKEFGGNDDLRVIFDVRNATKGTFKYMPVIVDVAYDSALNNAYCYLESAITSYIMLLKWAGGNWCYQVLFEFPSSQFSKYMYHSIILLNNFVYWTTDRYVMSGRLPGFEKRVLLQPSWNRLYSMTIDRPNEILYVAGFEYTENALFKCNLKLFSCQKFLTTSFTINDLIFNSFTNELYVATIQGGAEQKFLYRYVADFERLAPVDSVKKEVANVLFLDDEFAIYTNQQSIYLSSNINMPNGTRRALAKLLDPYALQYVFTFNQIATFDSYPYPYFFSDYHDLLYRDSLYLFYFYICGMDFVENDHVFLPQMDLNNHFLRVENCQIRFLNEREAYVIPALIASCVSILIIIIILVICFWRSKFCQTNTENLKRKFLSKVVRSKNDETSKKENENEIVVNSFASQYPNTENGRANAKQISLSGVFNLPPASSTPLETMTRSQAQSINKKLKLIPSQPSLSEISSNFNNNPAIFLSINDCSTNNASANRLNRVKFNELQNVKHLYNRYDCPITKNMNNSISISSSLSEQDENEYDYRNPAPINSQTNNMQISDDTEPYGSTLPARTDTFKLANYIRAVDSEKPFCYANANYDNQYLDRNFIFYDEY